MENFDNFGISIRKTSKSGEFGGKKTSGCEINPDAGSIFGGFRGMDELEGLEKSEPENSAENRDLVAFNRNVVLNATNFVNEALNSSENTEVLMDDIATPTEEKGFAKQAINWGTAGADGKPSDIRPKLDVIQRLFTNGRVDASGTRIPGKTIKAAFADGSAVQKGYATGEQVELYEKYMKNGAYAAILKDESSVSAVKTDKNGNFIIKDKKDLKNLPQANLKIVDYANRHNVGPNSTSRCYEFAANAIECKEAGIGRFLSGNSAYMAANQLAANKNFKEIKGLTKNDLPNLPAGCVVVWAAGNGHPDGHISISDGKGNEISDFKNRQMTDYGTSFRVFWSQPKTARA